MSPLLVATWPIAALAIDHAWPALAGGGDALDAVEAACRFAEADPLNHTVGAGGLPDRDGRVSLDAAVMVSPARRGGVCAVRSFGHPVSIARRVMERTPHALLAGDGAEAFARAQGFAERELLDDNARRRWAEWRTGHLAAGGAADAAGAPMPNFEDDANADHDTIGAIALDARGRLAAACSTSGLPWKLPGRVGDSPIVGHGLYCDPGVGACVATGHGELISGVCGAFLAVEWLDRGATSLEAATLVLRRIVDRFQLTDRDQVGLIVVDARGQVDAASLRPGFRFAARSGDDDSPCLREPGFVASEN